MQDGSCQGQENCRLSQIEQQFDPAIPAANIVNNNFCCSQPDQGCRTEKVKTDKIQTAHQVECYPQIKGG
ncbi:hypothetical protein ULO1_18710 [Carboxydocella sp. ULO1]|nr:hypothetical protein ULO1_18710 [Carboxydocella sp. ULO1]